MVTVSEGPESGCVVISLRPPTHSLVVIHFNYTLRVCGLVNEINSPCCCFISSEQSRFKSIPLNYWWGMRRIPHVCPSASLIRLLVILLWNTGRIRNCFLKSNKRMFVCVCAHVGFVLQCLDWLNEGQKDTAQQSVIKQLLCCLDAKLQTEEVKHFTD